MIARFGNADLKEIGVAKHRRCGSKTAARVAPDADAVEVDVVIFGGELFYARDLVFESVIGHVAVARIVKGL